MNNEESVAKRCEDKGQIGFPNLEELFLPSPPIRCWEEEFDGAECEEDCDDCEEDGDEFQGEECRGFDEYD